MPRPRLVIVTPALRAANNGNWQTAQRWAHMLAEDYRVRLTDRWEGGDDALMIALHARRAASAVAAWRAAHPAHPLLLALTGTDLYRDIQTDADAQRSLALASRLVVLNDCGPAGAARAAARQGPGLPAVRADARAAAQDRPSSACTDGRPPARREVAADLFPGRAPAGRAR